MVKLLVALDERGAVGRSDGGFFDIPSAQWDDFFARLGYDDTIVGGVTYRHTPPALLSGRKFYVLSHQKSFPGATVLPDVEAARSLFIREYAGSKPIWIAGGKQVYEQLYPFADEIIVSVSKKPYDADLMLEWDLSKYEKTRLKREADYEVYRYVKKGAPQT